MNAPAMTVLRERVLRFVEDEIYPAEAALDSAPRAQRNVLLQTLMQRAKAQGLWALGHPRELGGQGLPFMDYVQINEVIGRSFWAMQALGTLSLQDSLMVHRHGSEHWHARYLRPMIAGEFVPSFAMTEPGISSSDPTQLQTRAHLEGGHWVVDGRKWFTTGAADARYTTVMCRTEADAPAHAAFSLIVVPTDAPGYRIVRELPVLGINGGHYEIELDRLRVPADHLLGARGAGFAIAQERLGPGRIYHCMRWLGQAQRAFDLMCRRLQARSAFGSTLADKQLLQGYVFDSAAAIRAARLLTLDAARKLDAGLQARDEIAIIKVVGARMLHDVIDRAIQVHGAEGLSDDTPLGLMYRHAREARIYDGPDEVHMQSVARRVLKQYRDGGAGIDFGVDT
ncbi:acyl-CoA dehydrogenase family protein [Solimonas terrae]|uniref:Acyl-CoA dehydrogenase n=1 Tax=Solimonas terrae TaxID=1396819 RepID=A0A6M2BQA6_9GAMM|nr:acyl-CoA dehydrogenase family protein [Solimonas terrae]NGY04269.1 acyl-CoA dehydrogenase [Solimonas terrae]